MSTMQRLLVLPKKIFFIGSAQRQGGGGGRTLVKLSSLFVSNHRTDRIILPSVGRCITTSVAHSSSIGTTISRRSNSSTCCHRISKNNNYNYYSTATTTNDNNTTTSKSEQEPLVTFHINNSNDSDTNNPSTKYLTNLDPKYNGTVGTITINSPSTYNALTMEIGREFQIVCHQLVKELRNDSGTTNVYNAKNVQVIIVRGAGAAFSAGGNLPWLQSLQYNTVEQNYNNMMEFYTYYHSIRQLPVPIIASINGPAMGAGACLALCCDLRTANNKTTKLGFHFTKLGLHPGMGGSYLLQQAIGGPNAIINEIILLGKILNGTECYKYQLVNRIDDIDSNVPAYEIASELIQSTHPVAVRSAIRTLRFQHHDELKSILHEEALNQAICYNQYDWGEGTTAIAQKRTPNFGHYHSYTGQFDKSK